MSAKKNQPADKNDKPALSKKDTAAIEANKPPNADPNAPKPTPKNKDAGPQPVKSPGKHVFCRHSLRPSELFEAKDVVFFREGPAGVISVIARHEADTRFAEIESQDSSQFNKQTGIGTTVLELKGGDKVTIAGDKITVTPKEGPTTSEGPTLNVHHADVQG